MFVKVVNFRRNLFVGCRRGGVDSVKIAFTVEIVGVIVSERERERAVCFGRSCVLQERLLSLRLCAARVTSKMLSL